MHVMLDLETLGKRPGAIILSIGAHAFDPVVGLGFEGFYANIDQASCEAAGLVSDPETIEFWSRQSAEAQAALTVDPRPLADVLQDFTAFWMRVGGRRLWAHGATFDPPLLEAAYLAAGLPVPWRYSDPRDTRTIYELAGVQPDRSAGVHHHAEHDAINQSKAVIEAYRALGLSVESTPLATAARDVLEVLESYGPDDQQDDEAFVYVRTNLRAAIAIDPRQGRLGL